MPLDGGIKTPLSNPRIPLGELQKMKTQATCPSSSCSSPSPYSRQQTYLQIAVPGARSSGCGFIRQQQSTQAHKTHNAALVLLLVVQDLGGDGPGQYSRNLGHLRLQWASRLTRGLPLVSFSFIRLPFSSSGAFSGAFLGSACYGSKKPVPCRA